MSILAVQRIVETVAAHEPARYEKHAGSSEAAVAVVVRENAGITEALFILRATQEGDPWSGHMAFPGGRREDHDDSLRQTAERETEEEIGLDLLRHSEFVGEIDSVRANPRGRNIDMIVTPYVFHLTSAAPPMAANYEVADILWGSLDDMYTGAALTTGDFRVGGENHRFPGYDVQGQVVWGLTYRMLDQFFGMMDPQWTPHPE